MSKYLFKTICPACSDKEIISWCHDSKTCGGARYIDEDLYLHCNKCNNKTFLFNSTFNCGKHDSRKPDKMHVMKALYILEELSEVPDDILMKMIENVRRNCGDY